MSHNETMANVLYGRMAPNWYDHRFGDSPSEWSTNAGTGGKVHAGSTTMNTATLVNSPTVRPIRSWAGMIEAYREAYRPTSMSQSRAAPTRRRTVSLCINAFQADRQLKETIDSCLAQRDAELELVIVDNSSNGTCGILNPMRDDRIQMIRSETTIPSAEIFNLAVQHTSGEFVKLIYAGDALDPGCIAKQANVLEENPDVALVAVRTNSIDEKGKLRAHRCGLAGLVGRHSSERVIKTIAHSSANPIGPLVSGLFRKSDFNRSGGCPADVLFPMDMGMWLRLLGHGGFVGLSDTLASSRTGGGSVAQLNYRRTSRAPAQGGDQ